MEEVSVLQEEKDKLMGYVENYKVNTEMLENKIELLTEKYQ